MGSTVGRCLSAFSAFIKGKSSFSPTPTLFGYSANTLLLILAFRPSRLLKEESNWQVETWSRKGYPKGQRNRYVHAIPACLRGCAHNGEPGRPTCRGKSTHASKTDACLWGTPRRARRFGSCIRQKRSVLRRRREWTTAPHSSHTERTPDTDEGKHTHSIHRRLRKKKEKHS